MDIEYLLLLQKFREMTNGVLNDFLMFITKIAVDYYILIPSLIIFWIVSKKEGTRILLSYGLSLFFNAILKLAFCVYRPWIRDNHVKPLQEAISGATGYSFPSGHATSSSGFYSGLIVIYKKYKGFVIFAIIMIVLTMFSRNYVGVHTPQDVFVGALTGVFSAFIISKTMDYIDKYPSKDIFVLIIAIVITIIGLIYISYKKYPMDYVDGNLLVNPKSMVLDGYILLGSFFGIVLGWFIEKRWVKFNVEGTKYQKIMRSLVGAILVVFYRKTVIGGIGGMMRNGFVYFLLQASISIIFMCIYPMTFNKFTAKNNKRNF